MKSIWAEVRFGLRSLRKSPGFSLVAILTLALGIGANTAIFSVVDAVLLHPLPYPDPGRITVLYRTNPEKGQEDGTFSHRMFTEIEQQTTAFQHIAAYHVWPFTITGPGEPTQVGGVASSADLFPLLGIRPIAGRAFTPEEDRRGAAPVALISERMWEKRFHKDPGVTGKAIDVGGEAYTIVGVFPANVRFPQLGEPPEIWVPLMADPALQALAASHTLDPEKASYLNMLGRLKPGETLAQAQAQADTIAARLVKANPEDNQGMGLRVALLEHEVSKNYRTALGILLGAVGLVLLIACANVANLLVARATMRQREMALRLALGAGKSGIVRQMLVESIELALAGGVAGAWLAYFAVSNLTRWIPHSFSQFHGVTVNAGVLLFAAAVSVAAGILFGSLPAWHVSDLNVYATLKEGGRGMSEGSRRRRLREVLVVVEVALAVVLLAGAGLLLRSFSRLMETNPGFEARGVMTASVNLPRSAYRGPAAWSGFVKSALERLRGQPGVSEAAAAVSPPMGGSGIRISVTYTVAGLPAPQPGHEPEADFRPVSPGYFSVMRIPLVAGRDVAPADSASSAPVCMVNQALAAQTLRGRNPLGMSLVPGQQKPCQIVGVVGNVQTSLGEPPNPAIYVPFDQNPVWMLSLVARTPRSTSTLAPTMRDSVRSVDRVLPVETATMAHLVNRSIAQQRFRTVLVGVFAGLAILLAAVGISGVLAYSVSRRTHEIGLRMALGAAPGEVLRQVVGQGLKLVGVGALAGLAAALALNRLMSSLLYEVGPGDLVTYAGVALVLLVVALGACAFPALRASRVDPTVALRYE
jgi:putative ABC transport system permease protein